MAAAELGHRRVGQAFELGGARQIKEKLETRNQKLEGRNWKKTEHDARREVFDFFFLA